MAEKTLEQRVAALFQPPALLLEGGVEEAQGMVARLECQHRLRAYAERREQAGIRVDLEASGHYRVVAYWPPDAGDGPQEEVLAEGTLEALLARQAAGPTLTLAPDRLPQLAEAGNTLMALTDQLVALAVQADAPNLRAVAWRIKASRERIAWLSRDQDPAESRTIRAYEAQAQAAEAEALSFQDQRKEGKDREAFRKQV